MAINLLLPVRTLSEELELLIQPTKGMILQVLLVSVFVFDQKYG